MALFSEFERLALMASETNDHANQERVFYYVDVMKEPAAALRIARMESERRSTIRRERRVTGSTPFGSTLIRMWPRRPSEPLPSTRRGETARSNYGGADLFLCHRDRPAPLMATAETRLRS
jgi:hypothetical protein